MDEQQGGVGTSFAGNHGVTFADLPLIATCSEYCHQGTFSEAWTMCRGKLFSGRNNILRKTDYSYLEWTDATQFRADLSSTASEIEKQVSTATLAHLWCLLDPFANVIFISKTLRLFKEGKTVKVGRSVVDHPYGKCESGFCLDDMQSATATKSRSISGNERISLRQNTMQICGLHCPWIETGICSSDVPVSSGNALSSLGGSDAVSPWSRKR